MYRDGLVQGSLQFVYKYVEVHFAAQHNFYFVSFSLHILY